MGKITGGEVSYGRTMKTGDFENKRVDVKLSFSVEDGEDHTAILQAAAKEAHEKAHAMLGVKPAVKPVEPLAEPVKAVEQPVKGKPGPKPKEKVTEAVDDGRIPEGLRRGVDPLAKIVDEDRPGAKKLAADDGEELGFDEDAAEAQPEITDAALSTAMNRKVAVLKDKHQGAAPKLIKELINQFVEPPKKSHDIPQKLRPEFLKKLEALV